MAYQTVFRRYELKYLLTPEQKNAVQQTMEPYMERDPYGRSTVRNVYFDTENYRLVRRSIERPVYKEKLRIRSYAQVTHSSTVFVELKKKYGGVVYKRRMPLPEADAMRWIGGQAECPGRTQIAEEIDYFLHFYGPLFPAVFLSYEREAFCGRGGGDFRVTFDDTVLARREDVSLTGPARGAPLLPEGRVLMEIKCTGGIPLWMTDILSRMRVYKTSFSKYGTAYETMIFPEIYPTNSFHTKEILLHA